MMRHSLTNTMAAVLAAMALASCHSGIPADAVAVAGHVPCTPMNDGAVIPPNIAPLNFRIDVEADDYVTHVYTRADAQGMVMDGALVQMDVDRWQQMLAQAKGDTLYTAVYVRHDGQWQAYPVMSNYIAPEECDPYITYRLIQPGYVEYEQISICQRTISDFTEQVIYDNTPFNVSASTGQCVNCHATQDYNRQGAMQMHLRQNQGGTLICRGNDMRRVNLATDSTLSAGVYPAWHPTLPLIAYSVNCTGQAFHTRDVQKIEVIDYGSDLVLYDIDGNRLWDIDCAPDEYETFPAWSPDGRTLYYTSAHFEQQTDNLDAELEMQYDSLRYNIYCRDFDPQAMRFGPQRLVWDAASHALSAALPRISPDGRYLLFSVAPYGQFHIWHRSADLAVMDLTRPDAQPRMLDALNSSDTDSYHSWSSNGRWILFSSRRDDGNYTRLYLSYFDTKGHASTPVMLPQQDPDRNVQLMRSYNVPEWLCQPVQQSQADLTRLAGGEATPAQYAGSALLQPMHRHQPQGTGRDRIY